MPSQIAIVLPDRVPANHTFVASGVLNGIATWYEKTASVISGYFKLTMSMKFPTKGNEPVRHQLRLVVPTVATETINGVTYQKVTRQSFVSIDVVCAPDSTQNERHDICEYIRKLLDVNVATGFANQIVFNDPTT